MNKYFFIILLLICSAANVFAQETFVFKDKSKIYDVKVGFEKCEDNDKVTICNDKATFYLSKKNQSKVFQAIEMEETYLSLSGKRQKKGDLSELYGEQNSGVDFTDYNFDGIEDLVISNGNYLPYGGISNDVFLFSKAKGKFVRNDELSALESDNMFVDIYEKPNYIETVTKSGCCLHEKTRYRFVKNRLQKFYVFTEDATGVSKWVKLITRRLINGKWRTTVKRTLRKNY
jgi:hypothetical protein